MNWTIFKARLRRSLKSKTVWFGILIAALSLGQEFVFDLPLPPQGQAMIGLVISALVVVLRFVTKDPLDAK